MTDITIQTAGDAIWQRLVSELGAAPLAGYDNVSELKSAEGKVCGSVQVYSAPGFVKLAYLSIGVGPGRYMNIHVIPEATRDLPRFVYEGMLMPMGGQVSCDLFPDRDPVLEVEHLIEQYAPLLPIYNAARESTAFHIEHSRQLQMRAFASPAFLCAFAIKPEQLADFEATVSQYVDVWLDMHATAAAVDEAAAAARQARRDHMQQMLIKLDPDRHMVVSVLGEETVVAIEDAIMF